MRFVPFPTFCLLLAILLTIGPSRAWAGTFTDVPASFWASGAINTLAKEGIVHGFPGGAFRPDQSVTRSQFTALVDDALHLAPYDPAKPTFRDVPTGYWGYITIETAAHAGIVHGSGAGLFHPGAPITRQDMAVVLVNALHLSGVALDLAGRPLPFRDAGTVAPYATGAVAAVSRLRLMTGLPGGSFEPGAYATRAQAAQVVYNLLNLPPHAANELMAAVAQRIVISVPSWSLPLGRTEQVSATVYDVRGRRLPIAPVWSATGGSISPDGVFTADQLGPAVISAGLSSANHHIEARAVISVVGAPVTSTSGPGTGSSSPAPAPADLAFTRTNFGTITAGENLAVTVQVLDAQGNPFTTDQGRAITLTVGSPFYPNRTYTATDRNGSATFSVQGTLAGTFSLAAASPDLVSPSPATFQVVPGLPVRLQLFASPSVLVVPGRATKIEAAVVDAYGNPTTASSSVVLDESTSSFGRFTRVSSAIQGHTTVLGDFMPNGQAGSITFTAAAPGTSYNPASLTLDTYSSPATVVAGKGMWLTYSDWVNTPDSQIIGTAEADHVTHLYVEVATSSSGFYGRDALVDLLPKLHAVHIALIAWIYSTLNNPAADAQLAARVANFAAIGGNSVDGLAIDMEENLTPGNIDSFGTLVRQSLGTDYPMVAVIYPPQSDPGQTYASMYKACAANFNVLAPMDYWHNTPAAYTGAQAAAYVTQSLQMLRNLSGDPGIPISVIGQAYTMFPGQSGPNGIEERAALQAARSGGAIGYSMYRWGTASPAEWQAFGSTNW
jgi:hypothetical protein